MLMQRVNKLLLFTAYIHMTSIFASSEEHVKSVHNFSHLKKLIERTPTKPVVAKLYTDVCPSCKTFAPLFEDLAKENKNKATFIKINLSDDGLDEQIIDSVAKKNKVSHVPTTLVFLKTIQNPTKIQGSSSKEINAIKKAIEPKETPKRSVKKEDDQDSKEEEAAVATSKSGPYVTVESKEEFDKLVESGKPVVVFVSRKNPPCKFCDIIAPTFEKVANETPEAAFMLVDKEDVPELVEEFRFDGYPSFLIYKDGKLVQKFTGASENTLPLKINSALGKGGSVQVIRVSEDEAQHMLNQPSQEQEEQPMPVRQMKKKRYPKKRYYKRPRQIQEQY